ncbi:MAG: tetratricopeptide repeat protein [Saprospiraceae bacterium]|nr:tetratricopeptide repeat protein [Saprospiraceae bacterium]
MDTEKRYDLIEKHLAGLLTKEEQTVFDQLLNEDPSLAKEIAFHTRMNTVLGGEKIHQFRSVLQQVNKEWTASEAKAVPRVRRINTRSILGIAATIVFLLAALWFLFPTEKPSNDALFASNFEPYTMVLNQRSELAADPIEQAINQAVLNYNQQEFEKAATGFQQLREVDPANVTYSFYTAISQLANGESAAAITLLEQLLVSDDHLLVEQSRWYLALAYLKENESQKARSTLQEIESGAFRYEEAKLLLRDLRQ